MSDDRIDWVIHYVQDHDCELCGDHVPRNQRVGFRMFCDCHTHGLAKHGFSELGIVMDIGPTKMNILNDIGLKMMDGEKFERGKKYEDIIKNFPVRFFQLDGHSRLYVIFPDAKGRFPEDPGCEQPWANQYFYIDIIEEDNKKEGLNGD